MVHTEKILFNSQLPWQKWFSYLLEVELRRLEIRACYNQLLVYLGSPDDNDLWFNKHIMNLILALEGMKYDYIALGVFISVSYLGIFTMILTAAFRIIWRQCQSVFGSPCNKTFQKSSCVRFKQFTSFKLNSLSINFDIFALYITPPIAFFLTAGFWFLRVKKRIKNNP